MAPARSPLLVPLPSSPHLATPRPLLPRVCQCLLHGVPPCSGTVPTVSGCWLHLVCTDLVCTAYTRASWFEAPEARLCKPQSLTCLPFCLSFRCRRPALRLVVRGPGVLQQLRDLAPLGPRPTLAALRPRPNTAETATSVSSTGFKRWSALGAVCAEPSRAIRRFRAAYNESETCETNCRVLGEALLQPFLVAAKNDPVIPTLTLRLLDGALRQAVLARYRGYSLLLGRRWH